MQHIDRNEKSIFSQPEKDIDINVDIWCLTRVLWAEKSKNPQVRMIMEGIDKEDPFNEDEKGKHIFYEFYIDHQNNAVKIQKFETPQEILELQIRLEKYLKNNPVSSTLHLNRFQVDKLLEKAKGQFNFNYANAKSTNTTNNSLHYDYEDDDKFKPSNDKEWWERKLMREEMQLDKFLIMQSSPIPNTVIDGIKKIRSPHEEKTKDQKIEIKFKSPAEKIMDDLEEMCKNYKRDYWMKPNDHEHIADKFIQVMRDLKKGSANMDEKYQLDTMKCAIIALQEPLDDLKSKNFNKWLKQVYEKHPDLKPSANSKLKEDYGKEIEYIRSYLISGTSSSRYAIDELKPMKDKYLSINEGVGIKEEKTDLSRFISKPKK